MITKFALRRTLQTQAPLVGKLNMDQLKSEIQAGNIDTILVGTVDLWGRLATKVYEASYFLKNAKEPVKVSPSLFCSDFFGKQYGGTPFINEKEQNEYLFVHLDFNTIRKIGWLEKTVGILGNLHDGQGNLFEVGPRSLLQKTLDKVKKQGFKGVMAASELEYFMFRGNHQEVFQKAYTDLKPYSNFMSECSPQDIFKISQYHRDLRSALRQSDIQAIMHKGEAGLGQDEINLEYSEVMDQADQHIWFKFAIKHMAQKHGMTATFMAKPFTDNLGNSCHIHLNLVDDKGNAFKGNEWEINSKVSSSNNLRYFLGGWMKYFPDNFVFYAPTINSYKRLVPNTFAPTSNTWDYDNRTVAFRVCGSGKSIRIENRIPGADCNPYLTYAASIEAGLKGLRDKIEPPTKSQGNAYNLRDPKVALPSSLDQSIENLQNSKVAKEFFGQNCVDHFAFVFKAENERLFSSTNNIERARYFEQI